MSANSNGSVLEGMVEGLIRSCGYGLMENGAWLYQHRHDPDLSGKRYYAREVFVGEASVRGKKRRVEFFLVNQAAFPKSLLIECKWQEVSGSAEDKLFRLSHDIKKTGIPTIVIASGLGFSPGIISHLKEHVDGYVFRAVYSTDEFITAVNRGVLGSGAIKIIMPRKKEPPQQQELFKGIL